MKMHSKAFGLFYHFIFLLIISLFTRSSRSNETPSSWTPELRQLSQVQFARIRGSPISLDKISSLGNNLERSLRYSIMPESGEEEDLFSRQLYDQQKNLRLFDDDIDEKNLFPILSRKKRSAKNSKQVGTNSKERKRRRTTTTTTTTTTTPAG